MGCSPRQNIFDLYSSKSIVLVRIVMTSTDSIVTQNEPKHAFMRKNIYAVFIFV